MPGMNLIPPVVSPPRVNVCFAVVCKVPAAVRYEAPVVPADIEAVGVPLFTLMNANLAEELAVPPISKSTVLLIGEIAPLAIFQFDDPEPLGQAPDPITRPFEVVTQEAVPTVAPLVPLAKKLPVTFNVPVIVV